MPDRETARRLAWQWEVPQLGVPPLPPSPWRIVTKAFREDLAWAIVLPGEQPASPAVSQLLGELTARGVPVLDSPTGKTNPSDI